MKQIIISIALLSLITLPVWGQSENGNENEVQASYGYRVQIINLHDETAIGERNLQLHDAAEQSRNRSVLGTAILSSLAGVLVNKTVAVTESLFNLGIDYLTDASKSGRTASRYNTWREWVTRQNKTEQKIASDVEFNDFYCAPSTQGMYDATDLKFDGISCSYYLETEESIKQREMSLGDGRGHDVYYMKCSLRKDAAGMAMIAGNKQFTLQVDSLIIYPDYCTVPADGKTREYNHFDFKKRTNLLFELNIKFFSSWLTESGQMMSDREIGNFTIYTLIDQGSLKEIDGDRVFIYSRRAQDQTNAGNVAVKGECYLVPRSFNGDVFERSWNTGKYKLDISMTESCKVNPAYYLTNSARTKWEKNPVAMPDENNVKLWDKKKWMPEWKTLGDVDNYNTFFQQAWTVVKEGYVGGDWVREYMSPVTTVIRNEEAKALHGLVDKLISQDSQDSGEYEDY